MVVIYDKVAKKSPQDKRVKWYALVTTIKQVDDKEVVRLIADETSPQGSGNGNSTVAEGGDSAAQRCFSVKLGEWVSFFSPLIAIGWQSRRMSPPTSSSR